MAWHGIAALLLSGLVLLYVVYLEWNKCAIIIWIGINALLVSGVAFAFMIWSGL